MNTRPTIDLHQDLMLHINDRSFYGDHWQTDFAMLEREQVKAVVATAFPVPPKEDWFDPVANDLIERDFTLYKKHAREHEQWSVIKTAHDLTRVMETDGAHGLIMHIEGLNVIDDQSWDRLARWHDMGWRSLGIVWNKTNPLGGGTTDPDQGLTSLGKKVIRWCQERNMIVDFAHMNEPTFWDAAKLVDGPIYISHGNCRHVCDNVRNYSDEQLKQVAQTDGVVGVFFAKTYVTGKDQSACVDDVVAHMKHLRKVVGVRHMALGTDFGGIISGFVEGLDSLERLDAFYRALEQAGFRGEEIDMIAHKNAQRVLTTLLI